MRLPHLPRLALALIATTALVPALAVSLGGCAAFAIVGAMADSAQRAGSTRYPADYDGVDGHSYAVLIDADRMIESDHSGITARLTQIIDRDIKANTQATHHIPPARLLSWLYANPQWQALPRGELAERLGVERMIVVELIEYRLHEPGNRYVWDGVASGVVQVYEADGPFPDEPMYERAIAVAFPDVGGLLEEELSRTVVTSELSRRFGQRVAWLFYAHEEPNEITY